MKGLNDEEFRCLGQHGGISYLGLRGIVRRKQNLDTLVSRGGVGIPAVLKVQGIVRISKLNQHHVRLLCCAGSDMAVAGVRVGHHIEEGPHLACDVFLPNQRAED